MASLSDTLDLDFFEADEPTEAPMSDAEHLRTFGWSWDDPSRVEPA